MPEGVAGKLPSPRCYFTHCGTLMDGSTYSWVAMEALGNEYQADSFALCHLHLDTQTHTRTQTRAHTNTHTHTRTQAFGPDDAALVAIKHAIPQAMLVRIAQVRKKILFHALRCTCPVSAPPPTHTHPTPPHTQCSRS